MKATMKKGIMRRTQKGITMIEYALLAAVVVVTIVVGFKFLTNSVNNKFSTIGTNITSP